MFFKTFFLIFAKFKMLSLQQFLNWRDAKFQYLNVLKYTKFDSFNGFKESRYFYKLIFANSIYHLEKYTSFCACRNFLIKMPKLMVEFHEKKIISADLNQFNSIQFLLLRILLALLLPMWYPLIYFNSLSYLAQKTRNFNS